MRFSVIIACYNEEATLGVQLAALARQTYSEPFEVLICDNGSRDASRQVAMSYRDRLPHLRVLDASARRGPGAARNVGASASTAPWLAFCDADDEVADDWLAELATGLSRHGFVAGSFESRRLNNPRLLRTRVLSQQDGLQGSPFGPGLPHAGGGNLGVHRATFQAVGGFDPEVSCLEDTDFCWRVQLAGTPLVYLPSAVVHVRLRSSIRGMWAQGRNYGAASALLESRYGKPAPTSATQAAEAAEAADGAQPDSRPGFAVRVVRLVRSERSLGGLLWKLGWHVGHRTYSPGPAGAPADAQTRTIDLRDAARVPLAPAANGVPLPPAGGRVPDPPAVIDVRGGVPVEGADRAG